MKQASLNKVKALCGKESALMDGTPIIIVEPYMEYRFEFPVFRGRIFIKNQMNDNPETRWFDEIAEDFSPGKFSRFNPFDTVASIDNDTKTAVKMWDKLGQEISDTSRLLGITLWG